MQNIRRARAVAITLAQNEAKQKRMKFFAIAVGATAAILALPTFFF